jgi:hypothetical protein
MTKSMFNHWSDGRKPSVKALYNAVDRLSLTANQKTAGQRPEDNPDNSVNFKSGELDMIYLTILCEAVTLVKSGAIDFLLSEEKKENEE